MLHIIWKDAAGESHSEQFAVGEESPLYQLSEQDTLTIRIKPGQADKFYIRGQIESTVWSVCKGALTILMVCFVVLAYFLVTLSGPSRLSRLFSNIRGEQLLP